MKSGTVAPNKSISHRTQGTDAHKTNQHSSRLDRLTSALETFGDELAKREGYRECAGLDAVWHYLFQKYNLKLSRPFPRKRRPCPTT